MVPPGATPDRLLAGSGFGAGGSGRLEASRQAPIQDSQTLAPPIRGDQVGAGQRL